MEEKTNTLCGESKNYPIGYTDGSPFISAQPPIYEKETKEVDSNEQLSK